MAPPSWQLDCAVCYIDFHIEEEHMSSHCSCHICKDCLVRSVDACLTGTGTAFPPQCPCCDHVLPVELNVNILGVEVVKRVHQRRHEMDHPAQTYCCNPQCSDAIPPPAPGQDHGAAAPSGRPSLSRCDKCHTVTCTRCKKPAGEHKDDGGGGDLACPPMSEEEQQLQQLMAQEHWQECSRCRQGVQKSGGCNHITCRCKHQFCYLCGADWEPVDEGNFCGCLNYSAAHDTPNQPGYYDNPPYPVDMVATPAEEQMVAEARGERLEELLQDRNWRLSEWRFRQFRDDLS